MKQDHWKNETPYTEAVYHLLCWLQIPGASFMDKLYDLIAHADGNNKERLKQAFPDHVAAYAEWKILGTAIMKDKYKEYFYIG